MWPSNLTPNRTVTLRTALLVGLSLVVGACSHSRAGTAAQTDTTAVQLPELRQEILRMVEADLAVQQRMIEKTQAGQPLDADDEARRDSVFGANLDRMRDMLSVHGWPDYTLVGEDGSHGAWLLLQHADRDTTLQRTALALLEQAVASGDASGKDLAYLTDRVRVAEGRPQVYGTQLQYDERGCASPKPTEDEVNMDARRVSVGLEPTAAYLVQVMEMLGRSAVCGESGE